MTRIMCSQCGYFDNKDNSMKQCSKYCISMEKDSICVDCEEMDSQTDGV